MPDVVERCGICRALLDDEDLFCPNCGTEAPVRELPAHTPGAFLATHNFECHGCGASMSYDASSQVLRCPFCGSEQLDERQDARTLAPNWVVPFVLKREEAEAALRKWLAQGFWRPGDLASSANVTKMTAVYVPYWVFSARAHAYWTADSGQIPPGARGEWYPLAGEHRDDYRGLLIGASGALTPAETSAICPFDLNRRVAPDQVDLENAVFEQFRVQRKYARPLAHKGFEDLVGEACTHFIPGRCRNLKVNVRLEGLTSEAVLLPVWIMAYRYRDRMFRFLLNGQSGEATGQAPTSWKKAGVVAGIIVICLLLVVLAVALAS